jgi:ABC-type polysaccharide/polyol phosphate export permease
MQREKSALIAGTIDEPRWQPDQRQQELTRLFAASLHEIWKRRHFWMSLAANDLRARYRRSFLGIGWSLLNPISMTLVICVAFHQIFQIAPGEYALYLLSGFAVWTYVSTCVTEGSMTFYRAEGFIRSYPAPLGIYPLRVTLGMSLHFLLTLAATLAVASVVHGVPSLWALVSLGPTLVLLFLFGWAVTVLFGIANVYFPDTQHLAQIGLQILFYLTPIIYPTQAIGARGFATILAFNPMSPLILLVREPIVSGQVPPLSTYLVATLTTAILVMVANIVLLKLQNHIVFKL